MPNFSIYVHVPWCRRRCPYCDFYLVVGRPKENYLQCLMTEWRNRCEFFRSAHAKSLYLGGGTPSLLDPMDIETFIDHLSNNGALAPDAEITIEVNPEDLIGDYAERLAKTRINRVSIGAQSLDDSILMKLGRKHRKNDALMAIKELHLVGFKNISVDLIIGVMGETEDAILTSLEELFNMDIPHISTYLLSIEEGTKYYSALLNKKRYALNDDKQADIYRSVQKRLMELGYEQYDISSYGQPGFFSRHNQVYWANGSYLGLGPGAHSMQVLAEGGIERTHNRISLEKWLSNPTNGEDMSIVRIEPKEALLESLAFGLRNMSKGISPHALARRHRASIPSDFSQLVKKYRSFNWLNEDHNGIRITREGALFADAIMRDILCLRR